MSLSGPIHIVQHTDARISRQPKSWPKDGKTLDKVIIQTWDSATWNMKRKCISSTRHISNYQTNERRFQKAKQSNPIKWYRYILTTTTTTINEKEGDWNHLIAMAMHCRDTKYKERTPYQMVWEDCNNVMFYFLRINSIVLTRKRLNAERTATLTI